MITRQAVANKIAAYLHGEISLTQLVDWAESAVRDASLTSATSRFWDRSWRAWVSPTCAHSVLSGMTANRCWGSLAIRHA